jgi:hypothetical protein
MVLKKKKKIDGGKQREREREFAGKEIPCDLLAYLEAKKHLHFRGLLTPSANAMQIIVDRICLDVGSWLKYC